MSYKHLFLGIAATSLGMKASAFCIAPHVPSRYDFPNPPTFAPNLPYCLSTYKSTGRHSCSEWQLREYAREANDYIQDLNRYVEDAHDHLKEAMELTEEAEDFAVCASEEVLDNLR